MRELLSRRVPATMLLHCSNRFRPHGIGGAAAGPAAQQQDPRRSSRQHAQQTGCLLNTQKAVVNTQTNNLQTCMGPGTKGLGFLEADKPSSSPAIMSRPEPMPN